MAYKYALDGASFAGVITPDEARAIVAAGFGKYIANMWTDHQRYDSRGFVSDNGKSTFEWQFDSFTEAKAETDGYEYFYFAQTPEGRANYLLKNLNGRLPNFIWMDWEDDETFLSIPDTIAYIHRASDAHIGVQYTGHYTRGEWWRRRTGDSQEFANQWLWDATNDHSPDLSYNPYGGFRQYMEQYYFDAYVLGKGPFDLNVYWEPEPDAHPDDPIPEPVPENFPRLDLTIFDSLKAKGDTVWQDASDLVTLTNKLVTDVAELRQIMGQLEAAK